jgi:HEPN domain-containing protein
MSSIGRPTKSAQDSGEPIVRTFHWLKWADSDYLAARCLLLERMVVQGCMLANTAVEKYLKALCSHLDLPIPRSHKVQELYREIAASPKRTVLLNDGFLGALQKAYGLRYPDDLPEGFNIALNQMKVLAELDRTVSAITSCFSFSQGTTDLVLTRAARTGDQRYLARNVMLNPERAADFFRSDSQSFEFRNEKPLVIEIEYLSPGITDDALFDQEGAILLRPDKVIELAFPRGPEKVNHKEMFDWPQ